jgi:UDP-N-acetylmuramyl pentapeptide phosphotransferase/UDP-N-acetylglucosamine-1-phosphate transferase
LAFIDDYIKVFKKNKEGLAGRFKILGQIGLGIIVGLQHFILQRKCIILLEKQQVERPATI